MKNTKLNLRKIKIESFVTNMAEEVSETIKGGVNISSRDFISCNDPSVPPYCPPASNPACTYPTSPLCDLSTENVNVCPY